jgi:hypothetical protein
MPTVYDSDGLGLVLLKAAAGATCSAAWVFVYGWLGANHCLQANQIPKLTEFSDPVYSSATNRFAQSNDLKVWLKSQISKATKPQPRHMSLRRN